MHSRNAVRSLLFSLILLVFSNSGLAQIGIGISVNFGPPPLPVYEQPICPADGYLWTPGYWAYDPLYGYYWVPGTWIMAPQVGFLWTPGYWGWGGGGFFFHEGYWGRHVGFYGGINYGFGYGGVGYEGGRWDNGHFSYNTYVNHVNTTVIHNTYNTTIVNNVTENHVSYNGGTGGVTARPTPQEESYANERHIPPVAAQTEHVAAARSNPELRASANHGKPPIAATAKPGDFKESGAVAAKEGGTVHSAPATEAARPAPAVHAKELQPVERAPAPSTGNTKKDQKNQQQQQKLDTQQTKERQSLQAKQEQDHARLPQKPANEPKQQPLEQKHQQQTTQLAAKHTQQQQQLQQHQQPAAHAAAPKQSKEGKG